MLPRLLLVLSLVGCLAPPASASSVTFNGTAEFGTGENGYFYGITGGKFPTGVDPNGDNASGGTFRFITDDPGWGYPIDIWRHDDWYPENAGIALTLRNGAAIVYDNNGIEDGSYGNFYDAQAQGTTDDATPGLHRTYGMSNNWDFMYASYFKLEQDTTFTSITGYYDTNGSIFDPSDRPFDINSLNILMRINFWSKVGNCQLDAVGCDPVNTGSFRGDVFSTDLAPGSWAFSDSGVVRRFSDGSTETIGRFTYTLDTPVTLQAGEYFYGPDAAIVPEPGTVVLLGSGLLAVVIARRRRAPR